MYEDDINLDYSTNVQRNTEVKNPWRRFFAWSLDTSLYSLFWAIVTVFIIPINTLYPSNVDKILLI